MHFSSPLPDSRGVGAQEQAEWGLKHFCSFRKQPCHRRALQAAGGAQVDGSKPGRTAPVKTGDRSRARAAIRLKGAKDPRLRRA
jgi:hypothetical protein